MAIACHTAEDKYAGLPDPGLLATEVPDLDLYHPCAMSCRGGVIAVATECEAAGMTVDPRIINSEGAGVYLSSSRFAFANSPSALSAATRWSRHSLSATLIVEDESGMQRDYWHDSARCWNDMQSAAEIGRAGERIARSRAA